MSARGAVSTKRRCECGDPAPYSTPRKQADLLAALKGSATRAGGACPVSGSSKTFLLPNRHTIQRPDLAFPGGEHETPVIARGVLRDRAPYRPCRIPSRAKSRIHKGQLHQVRVLRPHARRRPSLHRRVRPERFLEALSHHARPHALQHKSLRQRSLPRHHRPLSRLREGGLHLCLPGRPRPLDVRRQVRPHAPAQAYEVRPERFRRKHGHLGHHRVVGQKHSQQQWPRRHVGHFLSRLLRRRGLN